MAFERTVLIIDAQTEKVAIYRVNAAGVKLATHPAVEIKLTDCFDPNIANPEGEPSQLKIRRVHYTDAITGQAVHFYALTSVPAGDDPPDVAIGDDDDTPWIGGGGIRLFFIESIESDYMMCKPVELDGTVLLEAVALPVAKAWHLRHSKTSGTQDGTDYNYVSHDVAHQERTSQTSGKADERQQVTETYEVGDYVVAARLYTGVTVGGNAVEWLDINMGGKAWAQK